MLNKLLLLQVQLKKASIHLRSKLRFQRQLFKDMCLCLLNIGGSFFVVLVELERHSWLSDLLSISYCGKKSVFLFLYILRFILTSLVFILRFGALRHSFSCTLLFSSLRFIALEHSHPLYFVLPFIHIRRCL